jgi:polar amino acid transport system permease protein/polar amino acid transport system substrate-binding protein
LDFIVGIFTKIADDFNTSFIYADRWKQYLEGLSVTLQISFFAIILGLVIGAITALCILSQKNGKKNVAGVIASAYVSVIRGTPLVLQMLMIYYVIFGSINISKVIIGTVVFAINSGAYIAEILRAGILAVDHGQTEASRSLGLTGGQTMRIIVLPQAVKNVLPAMVNEFVTLIKETAIIGYIGTSDLTKSADYIVSRIMNYMPLLIAGVIYFIVIKILTQFASALERRLRKSDLR